MNKNLKFYMPATSTILSFALIAGSFAASAIYYNHENISVVSEANVNNRNIFFGEDGKVYSYFDIGEHMLTVSRNDVYSYSTQEIDGYCIKNVEVNSWRDNNKITYVNTVPVVVEATKFKDGQYEFNNFGVVSEYNYFNLNEKQEQSVPVLTMKRF